MTTPTPDNSKQPRSGQRAGDETAVDAELGIRDQQALDALVTAEFDLDAVPSEMRERASVVARVLGLLETDAAQGAESAAKRDVVCQRAASMIGAFNFNPESVKLVAADDDALEALVLANMDPSRVASGMRRRAEHHAAILGLLGDRGSASSLDARNNLVAGTLARIDAHEQARRTHLMVAPVEPVGRRRIRLPDLISIAAMLLIAASVIWPVAGAMRDRSRQTACLGNFGSLASAFGSYTNDNKAALPMASASAAGQQWWNVGRDPAQSNSANLYTLVRRNYGTLDTLACAGNSDAVRTRSDADARDWARFQDVSYSFLNLFGRRGAATGAVWHSRKPVVLLSDRSAVVVRAHAGEPWIDVMENSLNHAGRGQTILLTDGSSRWLTTPMLDDKDNIWIPTLIEVALRQQEKFQRGGRAEPLRGSEVPTNDADAFMCP